MSEVSRLASIAGGCAIALIAVQARAADMAVKAKAATTEVAPGWISTVSVEVQYYSWTSNRGFPTINDPVYGNPGKGTQIYTPTAYTLTGLVANDLKLEFVARTGAVSAEQSTPGQQGRFASTTDSQLSSTLTYSGFNGIQPYVAMLLNLPTGASALYGTDRFARMDPDLVALSTYGEGFNVGPTAGVNIPLSAEWLLSFSGGYTFRGEFKKEGAIDLVTLQQPTDRVKAGDSATVTASLGYTMGAVAAQGSVSYARDTPSTMNGLTQYRAGPRLTVTGSGSYAWTDQWRTSVNGFFTHADKLAMVDAAFNLIPEAFNSNSNVFRVNTDTSYQFGNGFSLGPTVSYLYRDRNAYDPVNFAFVPAKTRYSAGAVAGYAYQNFSLTARAERIWTRENDNPDKVAGGLLFPGTGFPVLSSDGWLTSLGATVQF